MALIITFKSSTSDHIEDYGDQQMNAGRLGPAAQRGGVPFQLALRHTT